MKILIFGAGRSSVYLIFEMQKYCERHSGILTLLDQNLKELPTVLKNHPQTVYVEELVGNTLVVNQEINSSDLVISMLPPSLHVVIAKLCLHYGKNLITASYVSEKMKFLDAEVRKKGLLFLNEVGVDPGLDHVSALKFMDKIKAKGASIKGFKSHTGGIVAEKTLENLWNYKITWNPKNVVGAGREGAVFLKENQQIKVNYLKVFSTIQPVKMYNELYDSYPNRDSLKYIDKYNLNEVTDCYRGTLRHEGFCEAWSVFIQLGITDDSRVIRFEENSTRQDFLAFFLGKKSGKSTKEVFLDTLNITSKNPIFKKFEQLNFFENSTVLVLFQGTPAAILQSILVESWKITPSDNDMLVMQHEVDFELNGKTEKATSSLKVVGKDHHFTAMAITVGATLFEAFKLVFENKIQLKGVCIPTEKTLYTQLIEGVKSHDIVFDEIWE